MQEVIRAVLAEAEALKMPEVDTMIMMITGNPNKPNSVTVSGPFSRALIKEALDDPTTKTDDGIPIIDEEFCAGAFIVFDDAPVEVTYNG